MLRAVIHPDEIILENLPPVGVGKAAVLPDGFLLHRVGPPVRKDGVALGRLQGEGIARRVVIRRGDPALHPFAAAQALAAKKVFFHVAVRLLSITSAMLA